MGRSTPWIQGLLVLFILVLVNLLAGRFHARWDLTENKEYTLNDATRRVLGRLDDVVNVTVYFSRELPSHFATLDRQVKDLLDEFRAAGEGDLNVEFIDPADDPALEQSLRMMGIPKLQLSSYQSERAEVMNAYLGVAIQYEDRTQSIPVVQDVSRLEYELTSAILKVSGESRTVGMAAPGGQLSPERQGLQQVLAEQYTVRPIDPNQADIPDDIHTLVVVDEDAWTEAALYRIDRFVMRGGKLLVLAGGVAVELNTLSARDREIKMGSMLRTWGVEIQNRLVVDAQAPLVAFDVGFFLPLQIRYPWFPQVVETGLSAENPVTARLQSLVLPWASPLRWIGDDSLRVATEVLARSSERSFSRSAPYNLNPQAEVAPPADGFVPQDLVLAVTGRVPSHWAGQPSPLDTLGTGEPGPAVSDETQILVVGSPYAFDSRFLQQFPANTVFAANAVDWMTLGDELISIRSRTSTGRPIREVEDDRKGRLKALAMFPVPVLVVIFGLVRARLRKNRFQRYRREYGEAA